jgi:hemoglobin-like flavoprotein
MDAVQIALVQSSFAKVAPISEEAARLFYARLFELAPQVQPLFANSDMKEQGRKLMSMLGAVVAGLSHLEALLPTAQRLAVRHVDYGVKAEHYPLVGQALLDTLALGLGDAFTNETRDAWTVAYGTLSSVMIEAAGQAA